MKNYNVVKRFCRHTGIRIPSATLALLAAASLIGNASGDSGPGRSAVTVALQNTAGKLVGKVQLIQLGDKVRVVAKVIGLAPGFHGFHVHTVGECSPPFTSALGHYNPGGLTHRDHAGDLPTLLANDDGAARATFRTDRFTLEEVFGRALIVHAGPDNYANIPIDRYDPDPDATTLATGDAGARVACGVIGLED